MRIFRFKILPKIMKIKEMEAKLFLLQSFKIIISLINWFKDLKLKDHLSVIKE